MYSSRSNYSGKSLDEDLQELYTSRPGNSSERTTPRYSKSKVPPISIPSTVRECPDHDSQSMHSHRTTVSKYSPRSPLFSPRYSQSQHSHQHHSHPNQHRYSDPRTSVPVQSLEKKTNYVVPAKHIDDEPISPIYFVPKKGAVSIQNKHVKVTSIHGDASSFKYDKQKGKVHVMISGNAKTRFQTDNFEFVLEVGNNAN